MIFTYEEHLDNLLRHLGLIQQATELLGKRLIKQGRDEFGRLLIARGRTHDNSKFFGVEWDYFHVGNEVPQDELQLAIRHHRHTNPHHPEYWGGIDNMPLIAVAEMVCDWYARSQEFGTDFRQWVKEVAVPRYELDGTQLEAINEFVDLLLQDSFVK